MTVLECDVPISAAGQAWTECGDHESISGETAESGRRN